MPKLRRFKIFAYHAQQGRCYYCGLPMWHTSPDELKPLGISSKTVTRLQATAEHLRAKQDGGRDTRGNIAAACFVCNSRRHKRKNPPAPLAYRAFVQERLSKRRWHTATLLSVLGKLTE